MVHLKKGDKMPKEGLDRIGRTRSFLMKSAPTRISIKLRKEIGRESMGTLVPQNLHQLAKLVVLRAIRRKYPDKPFVYHNLQSLIYWNENLF